MEAICDYRTKIRYVTIGYPGSVHHARIFAECGLCQNINRFLSDGEWIEADSAHKLTATVIISYSNQSTSRQRKEFNKYFSSFRVRIENCIGKLKELFGSLKELRVNLNSHQSHKFICEWIHVCCILYNIVLPEMTDEDNEL